MKTVYSVTAFICFIALLLVWNHAQAALYCYPHGATTTCFSDEERTQQGVRNPNINVVPQYHPYVPSYIYVPQQRRQVPEQDFGECTLALGCIKDRR